MKDVFVRTFAPGSMVPRAHEFTPVTPAGNVRLNFTLKARRAPVFATRQDPVIPTFTVPDEGWVQVTVRIGPLTLVNGRLNAMP